MANDIVKLSKSHASLLLNEMTSVKDCLPQMATCVDVLADNADVYEGGANHRIWRRTSPGQSNSYVYAHQDIDCIDDTVTKCIDVIVNYVMSK